MRAVVVYESMYGNTRAVAEAIGEGLRSAYAVTVVPVARAGPELLDGATLLVVGGPTHAHGMSRPRSRQAAVDTAAKPGSTVTVEDGAAGVGVREWLRSLGHLNLLGVAYDTRFKAPAAFTGRASNGITRELGRHGVHLVARPQSFFATKENRLRTGEADRARQWGAELAAATSTAAAAW